MYELILGLCNWVASLPMFIVIILTIAVNILKLIVTIRQLYAQEACERFGFAMTSRIFSWISFLSTAMYSWSVYYDHETGSDEKHFLIIGMIALALSVVFGLIAKSVKLPVMNILLTMCAVLSGGMFGVALYSWPSFLAIIAVLVLDVVICAIAQKGAEKAPDSEEVKHQGLLNSFKGINREYYQIRSNYLHLPDLTKNQQLIVASCVHADLDIESGTQLYMRIWLSGTLLWLITRKNYSRKNPYYTETITVDRGSFQYEKPETRCNHDVLAMIEASSQRLFNTLQRTPDYANDAIRTIDAAVYISPGGGDDAEYIWDAVLKNLGIYDPKIDYTNEYITKHNRDTANEEHIKSALRDLGEFFMAIIDLRYKTTYLQKLMYLAELPMNKRNIVWYVSICLGEQNTDLLTDASLIKNRIRQLESMLVESGQNQEYFSSLFKAFDTAIENLGGNNKTRFNAILSDWQHYRPAFIEAVNR